MKVIYIHGNSGSAEQARCYEDLFEGSQVLGFDYLSKTAEEAQVEFPLYFRQFGNEKVCVIAESIGAYFAMISLDSSLVGRAYFISPVADMEKVILKTLSSDGYSEKDLFERKTITCQNSIVLSYDDLSFIRSITVPWDVRTSVLYGERDNLQSIDDIRKRFDDICIVKDHGHWFEDTEEIDKWIRESEK